MRARGVSAVSFLVLLTASSAGAGGLTLDPSSFSNPTALLSAGVVGPIIKAVGLMADNRAYEPATPLGTGVGMDVSLQATVVKLPDSFNQALVQAGSSTLNVPFLPVAKLNVHKGIGEAVDVGFGGIYFADYQILGFDAKWAVFRPEEGPTWAIRLNYTTSNFSYSSSGATLKLNAKTFKPEILVSKKLDFADPYIGLGYEYTMGTLSLVFPLPAPLPTITGTSPTARGGGVVGFVGVGLKVPNLGLKATIDEQYSGAGEHALGAKLGMSF